MNTAKTALMHHWLWWWFVAVVSHHAHNVYSMILANNVFKVCIKVHIPDAIILSLWMYLLRGMETHYVKQRYLKNKNVNDYLQTVSWKYKLPTPWQHLSIQELRKTFILTSDLMVYDTVLLPWVEQIIT